MAAPQTVQPRNGNIHDGDAESLPSASDAGASSSASGSGRSSPASSSDHVDAKDVNELVKDPPAGFFEHETTVADDSSSEPTKRSYRPPSKWFKKAASEQSWLQRLAAQDRIPPSVLDTVTQEEYDARGPVPHESYTRQLVLVFSHALRPIAAQYAYYTLFPGHTWHPAAAFVIYFANFVNWVFAMIKYQNGLQERYGVFDQVNKPRDVAPDAHVERVSIGVLIYIVVRTLGPILMRYDQAATPSFDLWTPARLIGWTVALDLPFYIYHRTTHELDSAWWVHRLHHGTKHPSVLLSILAGDVQECLEIAICPLIASLILPTNYWEMVISSYFLIFVEAMGHCGARADLTNPLNAWLLAPFGLELRVEDHDRHHRFGRSGINYGKQSRVWDWCFNTMDERPETGRRYF